MPALLEPKSRDRKRDNAASVPVNMTLPTVLFLPNGHHWNSAVLPPTMQESVISEQTQEALWRVARFEQLQENWDSYGASPILAATAQAAKRFILIMDRKGLAPYFVSPGPNGEILVEYRTRPGKEAEVYFHEDGTRRLLLIDGEEFLFEDDFDADEFLKHVGLTVR